MTPDGEGEDEGISVPVELPDRVLSGKEQCALVREALKPLEDFPREIYLKARKELRRALKKHQREFR